VVGEDLARPGDSALCCSCPDKEHLPEVTVPLRLQAAILENLVKNVPLEFDFLFSKSHAEVISGKQEGGKHCPVLMS